jgi:hypothetical protein
MNFFHHFVGATIYEPIAGCTNAGLVAHQDSDFALELVPLVVVGGGGVGWFVGGVFGIRP